MKESDLQADWILKVGERLYRKVPLHQDSAAAGTSFLFGIQAGDLQSCDEGSQLQMHFCLENSPEKADGVWRQAAIRKNHTENTKGKKNTNER